MFKENFNSKQQGNVGIGYAIAYFTKQGYTVSLPLNDSQDYDLIIDVFGILNKVQVKTTRSVGKYGIYQVCLKSSGGTSGKIYGKVCDGSCDLLYILCANGDQYLIPKESFKNNQTSINLGKMYVQYRLNEHG